jgi:hypothetical protein
MADLYTSETNEPSAQEQAAIEATEAIVDQASAEAVEETAPSDRPEWLPEKFQSPEDLAKAYGELEGKLGAPGEETQEEQPGETSSSLDAITAASDEFMESGQLSDDTFKTLEDAGLPRDLVEAYMAGQQALATSQANEVYAVVGGPEEYEAMTEWASSNLDQASQNAFDQIVESGTIEQAKVAVQGLFSQYKAANGSAPALVQGTTTGQAVTPFYSSKAVTEAMSDPRYKHDAGYQAQVAQRLAISDVL